MFGAHVPNCGPVIKALSSTPTSSTFSITGPRNYYDCDIPGVDGEICGIQFQSPTGWMNIWGIANTSGDFVYSISEIPEPSTWLSIIMGFGLVGAALRRKRAAIA